MKRICPNCEKITKQVPHTEMILVPVLGKEKVWVQADGHKCTVCGDFIYDVDHVLNIAYIASGHTELATRILKKI